MKPKRHSHKGMLVWITGLPGSGKTVLAQELYASLRDKARCIMIDGDMVRKIMGHDLGHGMKDRLANAYRIVRLSKHLVDDGFVVICSTVSLFREIHEWNRENMRDLLEIYIDVPMETLIKRDKKGLYSGALEGRKKNVRGFDQSFDVPKRPHLTIENDGSLKDFLKHSAKIERLVLGKMKRS